MAVAHTAGSWDAPTSETEFQAVYTAHPSTNAALIPNDANAAAIITYLQSLHVKPKTFPTTGQDAQLTGLQNVLSGYQCGTVYKPIYLEAQAAVALALYLRAGVKPPSALVNGKTQDTTAKRQRPLGARDAEVGHHEEHERHGDQGQLRAGVAALRRLVRQRLHRGGHHAVANHWIASALMGSVDPTEVLPDRPPVPTSGGSVMGGPCSTVAA